MQWISDGSRKRICDRGEGKRGGKGKGEKDTGLQGTGESGGGEWRAGGGYPSRDLAVTSGVSHFLLANSTAKDPRIAPTTKSTLGKTPHHVPSSLLRLPILLLPIFFWWFLMSTMYFFCSLPHPHHCYHHQHASLFSNVNTAPPPSPSSYHTSHTSSEITRKYWRHENKTLELGPKCLRTVIVDVASTECSTEDPERLHLTTHDWSRYMLGSGSDSVPYQRYLHIASLATPLTL